VQPVKVPQHLEIEDVIAWNLGAVDLICVALGGAIAWWLYTFVPGDLDVRVAAAAPFAVLGVAVGVVRLGDLTLRQWVLLVAAYAKRSRQMLVGDAR